MPGSSPRKWLSAIVASAATVLALGLQAGVVPATVAAASPPTGATDASKVPHYFGPWPNWANSPLTLPTATVSITDTGTGAGATAVAQVGPDGSIGAINLTAPGHDYTSPTVTINAPTAAGGTQATATATVKATGAVVSASVTAAGSGYSGLAATVTGDGAGAGVTPSGGVDAVALTDGGAGYTMPTVLIDLPDDPNGTRAAGHVEQADLVGGVVQKVTVDDPGSGYTTAPGVRILDGTLADPISGSTPAAATATLKLVGLAVDVPGSGYTAATVAVTDPTGSGTGATGAVTTDVGSLESVTVTNAGSGYLTAGMKKFQDVLPVTCDPKADGSGCPAIAQVQGTDAAMGPANKFIPLAVPEAKTYNGKVADEYVIGLVQYRTKFSSDLPATLVRGYVQLSTTAVPGQHVTLFDELQNGDQQAITGYTGVTAPQWLGPIIAATKDRPVRIVFRNLLPKGADGDLFLPTDSTMMGSGMGPMAMPAPVDSGAVTDAVRNPACTQEPKAVDCFKDNRATLHLHGGTTPWISDGTPHQWITPAGESTSWPQGVSVQNVPDMLSDPANPSSPAVCAAKDDGCSTFYYTNQQSARLMFYHDHSWGITRLNVYAGEAAGYTITDNTEKALVNAGLIPTAADTLPLIVQDRTFVPGDAQLKDTVDANGKVTAYGQDPTWDAKRWGTKGSFWYHHVYMPAQNPGDPGGLSAYGRWMYGPWFWPPATGTTYGPIANPYYDPSCNLDDPSTWQYQTDPFCEPEQIPGTPNVSAGMEQFNDTPIVNGVAYPTMTLQPKTYRMRLLNAANDRFFNFQWYTADPDPANGNGQSEVKLNPTELAAAQTDPTVSPTPADAHNDAAGPDWVQIASEGGFLPAPAVIDGQQPTTWITDPTRFDFGNVDKHSMLLAPAERADVVVDFSKFAGKTLILYNDAPAAFPARVPSYDYYTGGPDLSPTGAPTVMPGYGPNTRTVMQVKIAAATPAPAFNVTALAAAFKHQANGSGVFESGQHPAIVGQAAYNSAYGTSCRGQQQLQRQDGKRHQVRRSRARQRHRHLRLQHPCGSHREDDDGARTEGDPRRDELLDVRRLRAHAGQPRRGGATSGTGSAERHVVPVHQPGDRAHRRHQPAGSGRRGHPHHGRQGRDADLALHPQRRGHAPDPLPPLRRPGAQPGHVGQHRHPTGRERARLEGHRADEPARGHHRRPAACGPPGALRGAERDPRPQPDDAPRITVRVQQHRPAREPDGCHRQLTRQHGLGVRHPLPHPQSRGDGHDASRVPGPATEHGDLAGDRGSSGDR